MLRAAWAFGLAEPLEYAHPYQYLKHALWLSERPDALNVVLHYDNWRVHYDRWTTAPLYYLFLLGVLRLFGHEMFWIRLIQCLLGGMAAVSVARIGARIAGSRGRWAGLLFAIHLPLIQICATTLTEALYIPMMLLAFDLLLRSPSRANALRAGLTHGLAALTRSVSSAFFAIIAFWMLRKEGLRRGVPRVALLALGGMLTILPWTARNYYLLEEPILIETFAWENLWYANALVGPGVKAAQREEIVAQRTTAEQRERAMALTIQNLTRHKDRIPEKIWINFKHLIRPEGLHQWLTVRSDDSLIRSTLQIVFEDGLYLAGWAGLALFIFRRRWNKASALVLLWLAYSLLMVVVVFHNEVRYRSQIAPFLFVVGIAGWFGPGRSVENAGRVWVSRVLAAGMILLALRPYPALAWEVSRARQAAQNPAIKDPGPGTDATTFWTERFQLLVDRGQIQEAATLFESLDDRAPVPVLAIAPRILALAGPPREEAAQAAWKRSSALEWTFVESRVQRIAWRRWTKAPIPSEVQLGSFDLGLIRGFGPPLPERDPPLSRRAGADDAAPDPPISRWTRGRSLIRLCASAPGPATLSVRMAAPLPAPKAPISTSIHFDGRWVGTVNVGREAADFNFDVVTGACPGLVEIRSSVWSRPAPPAELGVQVHVASLKPR